MRILFLRIAEFMLEAQIDSQRALIADHLARIEEKQRYLDMLEARLGRVRVGLDMAHQPHSVIMAALTRKQS